MDKYKKLCDATFEEIKRAKSMYGDFASCHEAYAVLLEEVDELWDEVKQRHQDKAKIRKEALQVAAMAIRMAAELTEE
jgi:NTP pyrophosphatase (non-canonical NTP hydrolase)